jgi:hypothetical protein
MMIWKEEKKLKPPKKWALGCGPACPTSGPAVISNLDQQALMLRVPNPSKISISSVILIYSIEHRLSQTLQFSMEVKT